MELSDKINQQKQQLKDTKDNVRSEVVKFIKGHKTLVRDTVDVKKCVVVYGSKQKTQINRLVRKKGKLSLG